MKRSDELAVTITAIKLIISILDPQQDGRAFELLVELLKTIQTILEMIREIRGLDLRIPNHVKRAFELIAVAGEAAARMADKVDGNLAKGIRNGIVKPAKAGAKNWFWHRYIAAIFVFGVAMDLLDCCWALTSHL